MRPMAKLDCFAEVGLAAVLEVQSDVGEQGVGGGHDSRGSVAVDEIERGPRQARPGARVQGAREDELRDRGGDAVAAAHTPEAARSPQAQPIRGALDRATEAGRIDKGLHQQHRMAEALRPVPDQAPPAPRQHPRGQVGTMPAGQDQKAAVVGRQLQPAGAQPQVPADPDVARPALQRRRGKTDRRHPNAPPARRVSQHLADLRQRAQIMMRPHQAPVSALLGRRNRLDEHLAQVHPAPRRRVKSAPFAPHPGSRKIQNWNQSVVSTEFLSKNEFALALWLHHPDFSLSCIVPGH